MGKLCTTRTYISNDVKVAKMFTMIVAAMPAFNEEIAIGSAILRAKKHVDRVVVIDDGSNDAGPEIAELAGAVLIKHEKRMGYGAAIQSCFEAARDLDADVLVTLDADGQHDPDNIPRLVAPILEGRADLVLGSRSIEGHVGIPSYRRVGMQILDVATSIGSSKGVLDSQSGFRAYSKKALNAITFEGHGMSAGSEILMAAGEKGLKVEEVPISCRYDVDSSTYNPISHGLSVLSAVLHIIEFRNPLHFFAIPGVTMLILGLSLGIWAFNDYLINGTLANGPALGTIFLVLLGFLAIFHGIMLHSITNIIKRMR